MYALDCGANLWFYASTYCTASSSPPVLRKKDGKEWGCEGERRSECVTECVGKILKSVWERVLSKYSFPCYMNYMYIHMYICWGQCQLIWPSCTMSCMYMYMCMTCDTHTPVQLMRYWLKRVLDDCRPKGHSRPRDLFMYMFCACTCTLLPPPYSSSYITLHKCTPLFCRPLFRVPYHIWSSTSDYIQ